MGILSQEDSDYLKKEFEKITNNVIIEFFSTDNKDKCEQCDNIRAIMKEIMDLTDKVSLKEFNIDKDKEKAEKYNIKMAPVLVFNNKDNGNIKFYGVPSGYEFSSLIEDIMDIGTGNIEFDEGVEEKVKAIDEDVNIMVFVTPTCPYCPAAVRTAHKFAMINPKIKADMIESYEFPEIADKYKVKGVPRVIINEKDGFEGTLEQEKFLEKITENL